MKKMRKIGFTIIEVSLFLAITAAIFAGVAIGTQNTIRQQKFNDSVQDFAEFLRGVYSQVSNPQSIGSGQSDKYAIYGKLITFGEKCGLEYDASDNCKSDDETRVYVYDVVGNVDGSGSGSVNEMLKEVNANALIVLSNGNVVPAGIVQEYVPKWLATIDETEPLNTPYRGSILIARHPRSGTINTIVYGEPVEVNEAITNARKSSSVPGNIGTLLTMHLGSDPQISGSHDGFAIGEIDFCIDPKWYATYAGDRKDLLRRNIRLVKNARNASGVEIIDLDSMDNLCRY